MNQNNDVAKKSNGHWAELIRQLFDRLTGKEASVTYTLYNLIIDIPRVVGPDGNNVGSTNGQSTGESL
jgi:hypothetical protein